MTAPIINDDRLAGLRSACAPAALLDLTLRDFSDAFVAFIAQNPTPEQAVAEITEWTVLFTGMRRTRAYDRRYGYRPPRR